MGVVTVKVRLTKNNRKNRRLAYIRYMNVLNSHIDVTGRLNNEQYKNLKEIARKIMKFSGCNN